jgi:hypothetical protein
LARRRAANGRSARSFAFSIVAFNTILQQRDALAGFESGRIFPILQLLCLE